MPFSSTDVSEAVVICTRNRPDELDRTLQSIAAHPPAVDLLLAVVDASDAAHCANNRRLIDHFEPLPSVYWRYANVPSLARQRNAALDRLPSSVDIVHFIDDDVTVHAHYFEALSEVLHTTPNVGGVGGIIKEPSHPSPSPLAEHLRHLFFLSHADDGRVLPSGCATTAQHSPAPNEEELRDTEWLSGCSSSYRRALLERHRFDEALTGYSMLEDLDLSYRLHQTARLVVHPGACLTHRRTAANRPAPEQYAHALTVHRRWFVKKHFEGRGPRLAYWWSLVGRLLAIAASSNPARRAALRGLIQGIRTVWTRDHPLLHHGPDDP